MIKTMKHSPGEGIEYYTVIKRRKCMSPNLQAKFKKILKGELKYTAANLGLNILINRLQLKITQNSQGMDECLKEVDAFAEKYPTVVKGDFEKIEAL